MKIVDLRVLLFVFKNEFFLFLYEFLMLICIVEDDELVECIKMYLDVKLFFLWLIGSVCIN